MTETTEKVGCEICRDKKCAVLLWEVLLPSGWKRKPERMCVTCAQQAWKGCKVRPAVAAAETCP